MAEEIACDRHGLQELAFVCTHIAHAVDSDELVGFFWGDNTDMARPDAWCFACEQALPAVPKGQATDQWFRSYDFKTFCAKCWDEAKYVLYHRPGRRSDGA